MEKLHVGQIGIGGMGRGHLRAILKSDMVELVAICDINRELLNKKARELGVEAYEDYKDLLENRNVEACVVVLPHWLYPEVVSYAAKRGVHILKEKPLGRTFREAKVMVDAAEAAGVKLMVATQRRYAETFSRVPELLRAGEIGNIFIVRGHYIFNMPGEDFGWRSWRKKAGGGSLLDPGYHIVDLLVWYVGLPVSVYCVMGYKGKPGAKYDTEDSAIVVMKYENGTIGYVFSSWASENSKPEEETIMLHGTKGSIKVDWTGLQIHYVDGYEKKYTALLDHEKPSLPQLWDRALLRQLNHFARCIREDKEPLSSGKENLMTMRVIEAAYRSEATGSPVALATIKPHT